jgi:hypothetical protein
MGYYRTEITLNQINMADKATVQQLTDAVATYNLMHCGVYPKSVKIISST